VKVGILYVVAAWLLLQITDVLSSMLPVPGWTGALVFTLLLIGFIPVLIFSWVYEMTPEGLKRESEIDRSQSITPETGRKINTLIVVLLILAIATVGLDRLIPEGPGTMDPSVLEASDGSDAPDGAELAAQKFAPKSDRSVAVLPFANRSAREEDAYFVDGIHDDILTQLARIGSLTVISRTSVEKFRDTTQSMKEIGATLGVKTILEGGVQRAGDRVRINVQLIDVDTDAHLWAQTYDRELTTANIFAIQSEISTAIADSLEATLSPAEQEQLGTEQTQNLAALEAYFRGRSALAKRTSDSLAMAVSHFEEAIELDPQYALAFVGLAETHILQTSYSGLPPADRDVLVVPLVEKALSIDERLGEAYIALGAIEGDVGQQEMLYRRGTEQAPGYVTAHLWYGGFLVDLGQLEEATDRLETALRVDPLASIIRITLGSVQEGLGRFDDARGQSASVARSNPEFAAAYESLGNLDAFVDNRIDKAIGQLHMAVSAAEALFEQMPRHFWAVWVLGLDDLRAGRIDVAIERYENAIPSLRDTADRSNIDHVPGFAYLLQLDGQVERAAVLLDNALEISRSIPMLGVNGRALLEVEILVTQGRTEEAMAALRKAVDAGWRLPWRWQLVHDPLLEPLRVEPRYQSIIAEIEADMAAQLARVREMEARGELVPIPPLPESGEGGGSDAHPLR
jgi:TolB-like protein/predicted negative regulator of RcsB-dependent stress response